MSLRYAAATNLLCTIIGWLVFFLVMSSFPERSWRLQAISYIFTGRFAPLPGRENLEALIAVTAIAAFFISFFIKSQGLYTLQRLGLLPLENYELYAEQPQPKTERLLRYQIRLDRDRTLLLGHGIAHAAIFVLLVAIVLGMQMF